MLIIYLLSLELPYLYTRRTIYRDSIIGKVIYKLLLLPKVSLDEINRTLYPVRPLLFDRFPYIVYVSDRSNLSRPLN